MKIYLLDINPEMTLEWEKKFKEDFPEIEIVNNDFISFMNEHPDVKGIVSPANSFGLMDGGYDKAIIDYLGEQAQKDVLDIVNVRYYGCQPVGSCLLIPYERYYILHTPTMKTPEEIIDSRVVFDCMYQCLNVGYRSGLNAIVIPAFGGCTGKVPKSMIAEYMTFAYRVFLDKISNNCKTNWGYARFIENKLYEISNGIMDTKN